MPKFQVGDRVCIVMVRGYNPALPGSGIKFDSTRIYKPGVVLEVELPRWSGGEPYYVILLDHEEHTQECNERWIISEEEGDFLNNLKGIA